MSVMVRPIARHDKVAWRDLWRDYLAFYETSRPDSVFDTTFERLLSEDPKEFNGFVAVDGEDQPIGLVHYLFHRNCWSINDVCYLQDLYVAPAYRGRSIGRALIEAVYHAADASDASSVYWLTQTDNTEARMLYDRVGTLTPFIKYARPAA